MEDVKELFAQNLMRLRKQMKITQVEFAEKINYSDKAVSKWERAESIPDVAVLKSIAQFFGVTIDYLVTEHKEETISQPTKYAKAVKNKNRFLISAITLIAIFACALTVFVSIQLTNPQNLWINVQACFIFPLPVYFLLLIIFSSIWAKKTLRFVFVSAFIWSILIVAFFITKLISSTGYPLIFIIGVPAQIITLMSFGIIDIKTIRSKSDKSVNSTTPQNDD